jgi:hypothetical protein
MSMENPLWGAPRIHGELLKLGFEVAQSSVAKYMVKRRAPPSQGMAACVTTRQTLPPWTCSLFQLSLSTCSMPSSSSGWVAGDLVWINVTAHPTAEWVARQITEAFPWDEARHYLIRDRDRIYCSVVRRRARHGHPGQAYRPNLALAEWLCRTADRIDPA